MIKNQSFKINFSDEIQGDCRVRMELRSKIVTDALCSGNDMSRVGRAEKSLRQVNVGAVVKSHYTKRDFMSLKRCDCSLKSNELII